MSRFKELNRIEEAIKHKNISELHWAQSYSQMRVGTAEMKEHVKHWKNINARVNEAIKLVSE